ncbi:Uncharacterized protein C24H6.11c [Auxenochlorella protothecoides]|uniref:Uncharacterized protein C24H6.11c n=2 Tax=Auxenochlorella protothecoides TaxID=3075 RepID=A0A087SMW6_AUXPR|nr:Uncharacterized protein C24H6.11c [Auxenochlorella protothecoides]KFM27070.1 Uncharacterized protein C24H6.11c [Auxenochlorella protothecoides]
MASDDIEDPLLPEPASPRAMPAADLPPASMSKNWPALRLSSMSTRRLSPSMLGGGDFDTVTPAAMDRHTRAALVGLIDVMLALPVVASFASIIFQAPFFAPYIGQLVKLVCLSSALHQLIFSLFSTMPFAMGQVQDVGLIFMSAIASNVARACAGEGVPADETLATVLVTLTISTAIVGLLIIATGMLKLASLVQYVPLPVIGGYLAFVGYFCLAAGVSLASGVHIDEDPMTWAGLASADALLRLVPALLLLLLITAVQRRFSHPLALPLLLAAAPVVFYVVLAAGGWTLAEAQQDGWVTKPTPGEKPWKFWEAWSLFGFDAFPPTTIHWRFVPKQAGKILALYFVVAFGSSMDVAAIQADVATPLDYNKELVTVGMSNLVTGMAGVGYTGSYIFSQTLFNLKMGVDSPVMGIIVVVSEVLLFMAPVNVMIYLPNLLFGAMVMWIGQDILKAGDWLFIAYKRVSHVEYALLLATFGAITLWGLELGIAAGIAAAALHFTYSYARVTLRTFSVVPSRSGAVRTWDHRRVLEHFVPRVRACSLQGYLFFGSSVLVSAKVLAVAQDLVASLGQLARQESRGRPRTQRESEKLQGALIRAPLFLILDFKRVQGMDATAARTFVSLHVRLQRLGVQLVITHLPDEVPALRKLLASQGLILRTPSGQEEGHVAGSEIEAAGTCQWFETMEAGLHFCEEQFLDVAIESGLCSPRRSDVTLAEALLAHRSLSDAQAEPGGPARFEAAAALLGRYVRQRKLREGEALFESGDEPDCFFIIKSGTIIVEVSFAENEHQGKPGVEGAPTLTRAQNRTFHHDPGAVVGDFDFFAGRRRTFRALALTPAAVWVISRAVLQAVADESPSTVVLLQSIILRAASLTAVHAFEVLEKLT